MTTRKTNSPVRHQRSGYRTSCGISAALTTDDAREVTCGKCVFVMLCACEVDPKDPRVTDSMRKRAGYHHV